MSSSTSFASSTFASPNLSPPTNLAADPKPTGPASAAVKPCCVCKDEKAARDECMLFSSGDDAARECEGTVEKYRSCMRGFGFNLG